MRQVVARRGWTSLGVLVLLLGLLAMHGLTDHRHGAVAHRPTPSVAVAAALTQPLVSAGERCGPRCSGPVGTGSCLAVLLLGAAGILLLSSRRVQRTGTPKDMAARRSLPGLTRAPPDRLLTLCVSRT